MKNYQTITRKGTFDAGHRVMNEAMKCFNLHGHTYLYELTFGCEEFDEIGYSIDFKEIKRVGMQWIDDYLDHASILNPHDKELIELCKKNNWKYWVMSLKGSQYCNPTVENIAREVLMAQMILFYKFKGMWVDSVRLYETPNCFTDVGYQQMKSSEEFENFYDIKGDAIEKYAKEKGILIYDDRKKGFGSAPAGNPAPSM